MLDLTGLQERTFEAYSNASENSYLFLANLDTDVSRWSKNAVDYFNLPGEYILDVSTIWEELIHPDDIDVYREKYEAVITGKTEWQDFEYRIRNGYGNYIVCTCNCTVLKGNGEKPDLFAGVIVNHGIRDSIDAVTGLHNNETFMSDLTQMIMNKEHVGMLKVGINLFSHINEMYGYEYGNKVLKTFADGLRKIVGADGSVYRLDSAKFAICMKGKDRPDLEASYARIQKMAESAIVIDGIVMPLKVAGGGFVVKDYSGTAEVIKSCLSYAMNQSKRNFRGELVFFCPVDGVGEDGKTDIKQIGEIHQSIAQGCKGFFLCYQPIVDAKTERIVGMEALLRWRNDKYGVVPPNKFIPWLESDPSFFDLGNWILRQAIADAKRMKAIQPDFVVNVNIAVPQLERRDFRDSVVNILKETGFPPEDLCLELTERSRNLDYQFVKQEVDFFHSKGIKIALDDFGTGASSLGLLKELTVDELKVDISFVRNIEDTPVNQTIVQHIIGCSNDMGVTTCVEGVENESMSRFLRQYNSTYYQGYHYSRPVEIDEFEKLVMAQ